MKRQHYFLLIFLCSLSVSAQHPGPSAKKNQHNIKKMSKSLKMMINVLRKMTNKVEVLENQDEEQESQSLDFEIEENKLSIKRIQRKRKKEVQTRIEFNQTFEQFYQKIDPLDYKKNYNADLSLISDYKSSALDFFGQIDFRFNSENSNQEGTRIGEGYFTLKTSNSSFKIGKQRILFGSSHFINPTNTFNPVDYSDLLEQENLAVWSLFYKYHFTNSWLGLIAVPKFEMSNVLDTRSRWIDFTGPVLNILSPGATLEYSILETYFPTDPALTLMYRQNQDNNSLGLYYSRSYDTTPADIFQTLSNPNIYTNEVFVVVAPYFDLKNYYGFDWQYSIGAAKIGIESLYAQTYASTHPTDKKLRGNSTWTTVFGIEYPIANWRLVLEYSYLKITDTHGINAQTRQLNSGVNENLVPSGLKNAYLDNIMPGVMYEASDKLSFSTGGIFNQSDSSYIIRFNTAYKFNKNLSFDLTFDTIDGKESTSFWGIYKDNDRASIQMKLSI